MSSPSVGKLTNADASARMLKSSVATLAFAFVMVMAAAVLVVLAITRDANRLEAERQRDRIEAAIESQVRLRELRFQSLAAAGDLQSAFTGSDPLAALQDSLARLGSRFLEFDGAYVVSETGLVFAGIEGDGASGQTGYDGLKHFSPSLPGGPGGSPLHRLPDMRGGPGKTSWSLTHDGFDTLSVMMIDVPARQGSLAQLLGPLKIVGYRRVTSTMMTELAQRYRACPTSASSETCRPTRWPVAPFRLPTGPPAPG
jgi:hypothetical protein